MLGKTGTYHSISRQAQQQEEKTNYPPHVPLYDKYIHTGGADDGSDPTTLDPLPLPPSITITDVIAVASGFDHIAIAHSSSDTTTTAAATNSNATDTATTTNLTLIGPQYNGTTPSMWTIPGRITQLACGEHHTLALTHMGDVYYVPQVPQKTEPVLILGPNSSLTKTVEGEGIGGIAAGSRHSVAVTATTGKVYAWGSCLHGECGTGGVTPEVASPTLVEALGPLCIKGVAAGMHCTMVLTDTGDVYGWGGNEDGQLGEKSGGTMFLTPTLIEGIGSGRGGGDEVVRKVAVGGRHSVFLTTKGTVYTVGYGAFGQLGLGKDIKQTSAPRVVTTGVEGVVDDVVAGWWHTILVVSPSSSV